MREEQRIREAVARARGWTEEAATYFGWAVVICARLFDADAAEIWLLAEPKVEAEMARCREQPERIVMLVKDATMEALGGVH